MSSEKKTARKAKKTTIRKTIRRAKKRNAETANLPPVPAPTVVKSVKTNEYFPTFGATAEGKLFVEQLTFTDNVVKQAHACLKQLRLCTQALLAVAPQVVAQLPEDTRKIFCSQVFDLGQKLAEFEKL